MNRKAPRAVQAPPPVGGPAARPPNGLAWRCLAGGVAAGLAAGLTGCVSDSTGPGVPTGAEPAPLAVPAALLAYYAQMAAPKPFEVRTGRALARHRAELRARLLHSIGLDPLPERLPLDVRESAVLDHPWCSVRRVAYAIWPGVYADGLLFVPRTPSAPLLPAMLCPHGHWPEGNANQEVQRRCLTFARLGYVVFSPTQNHYEDPNLGISHQTLMVWGNMRALDYLESLPLVDRERIGVAGESGGGLQTEMLTALDDRVRAATVVGFTCDFREILFPDRTHCACNHFPQVMRFTDHPEISTLRLPVPVQYLTMNDWTRSFADGAFRQVRDLYAANGVAGRVECRYFDTPHTYDRPKREATYRWMAQWVAGRGGADVAEPEDCQPFPVEVLAGLRVSVPEDRGFAEVSRVFERERGYRAPVLGTARDWRCCRDRLAASLRDLLGEDAVLPRARQPVPPPRTLAVGDWPAELVAFPSEGGLAIPTLVLRPVGDVGRRWPAVVLCTADGKETAAAATGPDSAGDLLRSGHLVVLPDLRFHGEFGPAAPAGAAAQMVAWERNGMVWGRPVPGMAASDLRAVVDGLAVRPDVDPAPLTVITRGAGDLAAAALFAAVLDRRITALDLDFAGACFGNRKLPAVPFVLRHGDVLQWAAVLADRQLTLRGVPAAAGDAAWLEDVFARISRAGGGLAWRP